MLVEEKYFPQDKNYLLKTVQAFSKDSLLNKWLDHLLKAYSYQHNPMGLEDDFILELREKIERGRDMIDENYDLLAAIYRHDHADNQLEFQWDGRTHMEVYDAEWKSKYNEWITELSMTKEIQRPIIKYAIMDSSINHDFLKQSIRKAILSYFRIRIRAKTIFRSKAA